MKGQDQTVFWDSDLSALGCWSNMVSSTPPSSMYVSETSLNKWITGIYPFKFSHIDLDWVDSCHTRWNLYRLIPTCVSYKTLNHRFRGSNVVCIIFFLNIHIILIVFGIPYKPERKSWEHAWMWLTNFSWQDSTVTHPLLLPLTFSIQVLWTCSANHQSK